jgi:aldehyde dehydrogenase family 7 protein A1
MRSVVRAPTLRTAAFRVSYNAMTMRRAMSTAALSYSKYPFLKELGLKEDNPGCYNGRWFGSGNVITSTNPADNVPIARVTGATKEEYEQCVQAMDRIHARWANMPAPARGMIVKKLGDALVAKKNALGHLIALEMGKILAEGLGEVQEAIDICDYAVGLSRTLSGSVLPSERPDHFMMERWNPLQGHVGVITAFNFPCAVYFWNAALSLVCGNTNMWKGASSTSLVAVACARIIADVLERETGIPGLGGVSTLATGGQVGAFMVADKRMELISFTGSTQVGTGISEIIARRFGKKILELGGNNAMIIADDANLDLALRAVVFSAVGTAGQRCTSLRRLYLHEKIYDTFVARLKAAYATVKIGNPLEDGVLCGPLHTRAAVKEYTDTIDDVKKHGGQILIGGRVVNRAGNFVEPTLAAIPHTAALVKEERFVPVLYVMKYRTLDEAIAMNNNVPQGLASSLFTTNQEAVFRWTGPHGSDCGIVNVNIGPSGAEIGGAFGGDKETGGGRESGSDSWKQYMRRSTCTINYSNSLPLAQGIQFGAGERTM